MAKAVGGYNADVSMGGNAAVYAKFGTSIAAEQASAKRLAAVQKVDLAKIDKLLGAIANKSFVKVLDELGHQLNYGGAR